MATKTVKKTHNTKVPTGLAIARDGKKFTFTWKIGDKDYGAWHACTYWRNWDAKKKTGDRYPKDSYIWETITKTVYDKKKKKKVQKTEKVKKPVQYWNVGAKTTTKTIEVDPAAYYPKTKSYLKNITLGVSGRRSNFQEKVTKKKTTTITKYTCKAPSDWTRKTAYITIPAKPSISVALDDVGANRSTFSWSSSSHGNNTTLAWFTDYEWQSMLLLNSTVLDGSKLNWNKSKCIAGTWMSGTGTGTSRTITEEYIGDLNTRTRWFRVRARGPSGASDWVYAKHVYALPNRAAAVRGSGTTLQYNQGYQIKAEWQTDCWGGAKPADKSVVEYAIGVPSSTTRTSGNKVITSLSVPNELSWQEAGTVRDTGGWDSLSFYVGRLLNKGECMWVRVVNHHDTRSTPGIPEYVRKGNWSQNNTAYLNGELPSPSIKKVTYNTSTHKAIVEIENTSPIEATFVAVYFKTDAPRAKEQLVGVIPAGQTSATIQLPNPGTYSHAVGVKAFIADYSPATPASTGVTSYSLSNIRLESSGIVWDDTLPVPPKEVVLTSPSNGTIRVTWDWTWTAADGAELSWADHEDAWESTNEPTTYQIDNTHVGAWNIAGLDIGTWYVRVRLYKQNGDAITYGGYSETKEIKLASAPLTPLITLSESVIPRDGQVTCYWVYTSTDGTAQMSAEVCEAFTDASGNITYGDVIGRATSAQKLTIDARTQGWDVGQTHQLAVRVASASGEKSEDWSVPVPVTIADIPTVQITSTSLVEKSERLYGGDTGTEPLSTTETLTSDGTSLTYNLATKTAVISSVTVNDVAMVEGTDYSVNTETLTSIIFTTAPAAEAVIKVVYPSMKVYKALTAMPLLATATGAGTDGDTIFIVERAEDYHMERPDGSIFDGYKGETIAIISQHGEGNLSLNQNDLLGLLDDGAKYRLIAIVKDTYGQSAETSIDFEVQWSHQALMPSAVINTNQDEYYTLITPLAPVNYIPTNDTSVVTGKEYYERVWDGGDNLIKYPYSEGAKTINGITFTPDSFGRISISGTATDNAEFFIKDLGVGTPLYLTDATYLLRMITSDGSVGNYYTYGLQADQGNGVVYATDYGEGTSFLGEPNIDTRVFLTVHEGATIENLTIEPILELKENPDIDELYRYELVEEPSGNPKTNGYYEVESVAGDYCDIYRLSADKPQLIVKKAEFGRRYIDPYPTLGNMGGHRVVYMTANGDYITADNHAAWIDYDQDDDNRIDKFATIIDYGKDQVVLPYDIALSSKWSKDFTETHYLGGSVQGDWNKAISRTGSVKSNVVVFEDPDTIKSMRELADYPGICHIRTPDGSSYAADVQVTEDRENRFVNKKAAFSLDITRVDSERFDGMLYSEWMNERKDDFIIDEE